MHIHVQTHADICKDTHRIMHKVTKVTQGHVDACTYIDTCADTDIDTCKHMQRYRDKDTHMQTHTGTCTMLDTCTDTCRQR